MEIENHSTPHLTCTSEKGLGLRKDMWKFDDTPYTRIRIIYPTERKEEIQWIDFIFDKDEDVDVHTIHRLMECDCFNVLSVYIGNTIHTMLVDDEAHFKPVCRDNNNLKDHMSEWAHPSTPPVNPIKGPVLIFLKGDLA